MPAGTRVAVQPSAECGAVFPALEHEVRHDHIRLQRDREFERRFRIRGEVRLEARKLQRRRVHVPRVDIVVHQQHGDRAVAIPVAL